ncbi:MAG: ABC transporter permease [Lachnospiraceae bacterium]|nr:ABC transporter permease [Lachnospiraceae bacterium]
MKKKGILLLILALALLLIYSPILILAVYSFTDATSIGFSGSFSVQNYITLFTTPELSQMIWGTVILAFAVAVLSTVLGTIGAIGAFYSKKRAQAVVGVVNQIPVINADVVTGFSVCILLVAVFGFSKDTYFPLLAGQVTLCAPFVYLSVLPKLSQMDPSIYEAALDLGASPAYALRKVVIPQIMPGIISGFAMAITLSLDDYFVATYTKPATFDTISTYVVNATRGSQTTIKTALWALSTIIFLIVLLIAVLGNVKKRQVRDGEE